MEIWKKISWKWKDMENIEEIPGWIVKRYGKYGRNPRLNSEKIWKVWKKSKSNREKTGKLWKKDKLNSEMFWKLWKKSKLNSD